MTRVIRTAVAGLALSIAACGGGGKPAAEPAAAPAAAPAPAPPVGSLYERLGGLGAIEAVVKDFVAVVAADARINSFFVNTEIPRLEQMLVEQICAATGGPCTYTGKDMVTVHTGMKITDAQFDALVEDLVISLDRFRVGATEQGELLGALGAMRGDIVGK
jgi:hemoglobin